MNTYEITYEKKDGIYIVYIKAKNAKVALLKFKARFPGRKSIEMEKLTQCLDGE